LIFKSIGAISIHKSTVYGKQHKHVDLISCDVIDHHLMVSCGGLRLCFNEKAIQQSEGGNWKLNFDYKRVAGL